MFQTYWFKEFLEEAIQRRASDLHISSDWVPMVRVGGKMGRLTDAIVSRQEVEALIREEFQVPPAPQDAPAREYDFSCSYNQVRLRVHIFYQQNGWALAIRILPAKIPTFAELNFPPIFNKLVTAQQGLVLVTGPTGSGKSTTLATLVQEINRNRPVHIITIEDPIEYVYEPSKALIQQREVGVHTRGFATALRAALREDPDVILVGEMRDLETIQAALEAAETGHLVLSTLHTNSAAEAIERIVGVFPEFQQQQIRLMLADSILAIISQRLIPAYTPAGLVAAQEILIATPAVRNLIREQKTYQLPTLMQTNAAQGMQTMEQCLQRLRMQGMIT